MLARPGSETRTKVISYNDGVASERADTLATEEPLEIRLVIAGKSRTLAVTMRTPGADFEPRLRGGRAHQLMKRCS